MKFKYLLLLYLSYALNNRALGQDNKPDFQKTPTSPALSLLDLTPTSIERPINSRAAMVSLLESIQNGNGLPNNYATEFAPYWWIPNKTKIINYFGIDNTGAKPIQNNVFSSLRNSSVAIGFTNGENLNLNLRSAATYGVRLNLIRSYSQDHVEEIVSAIKALQVAQSAALAKVASTLDPLDENGNVVAGVKEAMNKSIDDDPVVSASKKALAESVNKLPVFSLDISAASSTFFFSEDFNDRRAGRHGGWVTMEFAPKLKKWKNRNIIIDVMIRDISSYQERESQRNNLLDIGGKFGYDSGPINVSFEYIRRFASGTDNNTKRVSGLIQYMISNNLYTTLSIGENFAQNKGLIALFGLQLGVGSVSAAK